MTAPTPLSTDPPEPLAGAEVPAVATAVVSPDPPSASPRVLLAASAVVAAIVLVIAATIVTSGGGTAAWAWSAAPKPSDWRYYGWGNPAMEIALPADWSGYELPVVSIDPSASPDERAYMEHSNALLRAGAWRASIGSQPGTGATLAFDWVGVIVESGDASLSAFADRVVAAASQRPDGRTDVRLPAGPAVEITSTKTQAKGSFVEVDYLLRLPDGRSLTVMVNRIAASGPPPDRTEVETLARRIVETLRVTP